MGGTYQTYPMIDPDSVVVYRVLGTVFILDFAFVLALGFKITPAALALFWSWPFIVVAGLLGRRIGLNRTAAMLEGIGLMYGLGGCLLLVLYGLAAVSGAYADAILAGWDEALGLSWPAYVEATLPFADPLIFAYRSFGWQPALIVVALVMSNRTDRMWQLILAALIASGFVAVLFPFFPAEGVFKHYGFIPPGLEERVTYKFTNTLDYLRGGGRTIEPRILTGLVSFPSYHTVQAVLFAWAAWQVRWLRYPMLAFNMAVLASIPIIGAHYFSDMIGGAVIAIVAIALAAKLQASKSKPSADLNRPALV